MSTAQDGSGVKRPYARPALDVTGPDRRAGGFYRGADGGGQTHAGAPIESAEEAAVAAVRLGYKVAAAQIERSGRLARRLRESARKQVGEDAEQQAVDAVERLLFDTMMAGLEWLESVAADPDSPLKRLLAAEFRLLASIFGLSAAPESKAGAARRDPPATDDTPQERRPAPRERREPAQIVLLGEVRRAVRIATWEVPRGVDHDALELRFYAVKAPGETPLYGKLQLLAGARPRLWVRTEQLSPAGRWRAAVCLPDGEQIGIIEIAL